MLQNVKLQNVMLQMNLDVNLIEYPEFSAIGKGEESPFIYDSEKKCHVVEKLTKVNFMSYYNCIQVKRWSEYTGVKNFKLHLTMKEKLQYPYMQYIQHPLRLPTIHLYHR